MKTKKQLVQCQKMGKRNVKHGFSKSKTYIAWREMKARCLRKSHKSYANYGGRGIVICKEWLKFENFLSEMGVAPPGLSLDRIDNNSGYFKKNCRWATSEQQQNNTRAVRLIEYNGEMFSVSQLARKLKIGRSTVIRRFT